MASFNRNNLDLSSSPYLQQHQENPIHWQEWNEETLQYAKDQNKLIFVSIGYATCHWCHIMANEAFSNQKIAEYLNEHFVTIKVDREQRPDLDDYFMSFAQSTIGHGGWPLNVVLTPLAKPFFVGTYFPIKSKQGIPGFLPSMKKVKKWFEEKEDEITDFVLEEKEQEFVEEKKIFELLSRGFDDQYGGFGFETKFPPSSTLLFLLAWYEETNDAHLVSMITRTLNEMMNNGLHDHLQGGFFRYAVDRQWQIPHFEKMLYDQAMHLWVYSWAYHLFGLEEYKSVVNKLIKCLNETFHNGDELFYAALDADTNHQEGETYLWEYSELQSILSKEELQVFWDHYLISKTGNFEGKNHLVKSKEQKEVSNEIGEIEKKLLTYRKKREQPFTDKKIVTSWNALLGIGLIQASRYCEVEEAKVMAENLYSALMTFHYEGEKFTHSSLEGKKQSEEFLEDSASVLLFCSYLFESSMTNEHADKLNVLVKKVKTFNKHGKWFSNPELSDFSTIIASLYDHPIPSSVSLAEMALFRASKQLELDQEDNERLSYVFPTQYDFANLTTFFKKGNLHELHVNTDLAFHLLPLNSLRMQGKQIQDCYKFHCRLFGNEKDLLQSIHKNKPNYEKEDKK